MKRIVAITSMLIILAAPPAVYAANSNEDAAQNDVQISLSTWVTTGSNVWTTYYPYPYSDQHISRLEFPMDGVFMVLDAKINLSETEEIGISYGRKGAKTGTGYDSDWMPDVPETDPDNYDPDYDGRKFSLSQFDTRSKSQFFTVDYYLTMEKTEKNKTQLFAGYQYQKNSFRMTNGVQVIGNGVTMPTPAPGTKLTELNSTWDTTYSGLHLGIKETRQLGQKLSATAKISYAPSLQNDNEGCWNLRPMNFRLEGGKSEGYDAAVGLTYQFNSDADVSVGYRYAELRHKKGGYQVADDDVYYQNWEEKSKSEGWLLSFNHKF
ncbi:omptin family outer membrane protease [Acetonema longum]|uniref:omptin family outer membrane protease n=1 Tax=Acetonema longum TaxID=2374 RepID=UPI00145CCE3F|nr:omptin family outer membrane protease [Acetonema longum]